MDNKEFKLKIISLDDFIIKCQNNKCLRRALRSKQCEKESKQKKCYDIYVKQQQKLFDKQFIEKDYEWEQLKEDIKYRDQSCLVMKILTNEEIKIVEQQDGFWLSVKFLDGAHIIPRLTVPKKIYDRKNVVLISRFFHSRLDNQLDLITGEYIGIEGMANWWTRIMRENRLWDDNYDYWQFRKDMIEK